MACSRLVQDGDGDGDPRNTQQSGREQLHPCSPAFAFAFAFGSFWIEWSSIVHSGVCGGCSPTSLLFQ